MTLLSRRLKRLREDLDLTQEAIARQSAVVSVPGWVKLENGQREPSEKVLQNLAGWLFRRDLLNADASRQLRQELLLLKYLGSKSEMVRTMAGEMARETPWGQNLLGQMEFIPGVPPKRGRPPKKRVLA